MLGSGQDCNALEGQVEKFEAQCTVLKRELERQEKTRGELEQILWHSADAPVADGRAERLEADVKSLKKKLREAELRFEGIPAVDGAGEGGKTVANLLAQNEALAKELLDARDPRVKLSLLSTLERYRRELVDKHAASTAPPSALGSIWPFGSTAVSPSPPGLGPTVEERLLHEQERNQTIKRMMQERIDRLSTLLTGERQARRDAQHWAVAMGSKMDELLLREQGSSNSTKERCMEAAMREIQELREACVALTASNTDLSHDLRGEEARRKQAAVKWGELVQGQEAAFALELKRRDAYIDVLSQQGAGGWNEAEMNARHEEAILDLTQRLDAASSSSSKGAPLRSGHSGGALGTMRERVVELEEKLLREGDMLDQERERVREAEGRLASLMGSQVGRGGSPVPQGGGRESEGPAMPAAGAGHGGLGSGEVHVEEVELLRAQLESLKADMTKDVEEHHKSTDDLIAQQYRAIRELQAELHAAREASGVARGDGSRLEMELREANSALSRERTARREAEAELDGVLGELGERRVMTSQLEGALAHDRVNLEGRVGDLERRSLRLFDSKEELARENASLHRQMETVQKRCDDMRASWARRVEDANRQSTLASSRSHELEVELKRSVQELETCKELCAAAERERKRAEGLLDAERLANADLRTRCIKLEGASADAKAAQDRERAAMAEAHASGLQAANSKEQALESDALAKLARAEADERLAAARELGSRVEELRAQLESAKDQCAAYERRLLHAEQAQADADCHARELSKEVRDLRERAGGGLLGCEAEGLRARCKELEAECSQLRDEISEKGQSMARARVRAEEAAAGKRFAEQGMGQRDARLAAMSRRVEELEADLRGAKEESGNIRRGLERSVAEARKEANDAEQRVREAQEELEEITQAREREAGKVESANRELLKAHASCDEAKGGAKRAKREAQEAEEAQERAEVALQDARAVAVRLEEQLEEVHGSLLRSEKKASDLQSRLEKESLVRAEAQAEAAQLAGAGARMSQAEAELEGAREALRKVEAREERLRKQLRDAEASFSDNARRIEQEDGRLAAQLREANEAQASAQAKLRKAEVGLRDAQLRAGELRRELGDYEGRAEALEAELTKSRALVGRLEGQLLEAGRMAGEHDARAHDLSIELARVKEERSRLEVSLVASGKNLHARTLEAQNLRCDRDELQSALRREREEHEAAKLELVRRNDVYHNHPGHGSHSERSSQSEVVVLASKMADERLAMVERDAMERTRTLLEELEDAVLHKGQFERAALILEEQVRNSRDEGRVARERLAEATREAERLAARQRDAAYKAVNRMQRLALCRAMLQWKERPSRMAHARAAANTVIKRWVNQSLAFGLSGWSNAVQLLAEARDSAGSMAKGADRRLLIESVAGWHANVKAVKVMGRAFGTVSGRQERTIKRCCVTAWSLVANGERRRARNGELVSGRVATSALKVALLSWASTALKVKRTRGLLRRFFGKQLHQNLVVAFEAFASVGREGREKRLQQSIQEKAELQIAGIMQQASESIGAAEKHKKLRLEAGYAAAERVAHRLRSSTASRSIATWVAWMGEARRIRTILRRCMLQMRHRTMGPALSSWSAIAMRKKHVKNKGRGALARWCARGLGSALQGWVQLHEAKISLRLIEEKIVAAGEGRRMASSFEVWSDHMLRSRALRIRLGTFMSGNRVMLLGRGIGAFKASRAVGREKRREEGVARALEESKLEAMAGIERHTRREAQIRAAAIKNVLQKWSNQTLAKALRVWVTSAAERRAGVVEMSRRAAERDQIGLLLRSAMGAWAGVASKAGKARAVVMRAMARWRGDALWDGFVAFSGLLREKKEREEWAKSYKGALERVEEADKSARGLSGQLDAMRDILVAERGKCETTQQDLEKSLQVGEALRNKLIVARSEADALKQSLADVEVELGEHQVFKKELAARGGDLEEAVRRLESDVSYVKAEVLSERQKREEAEESLERLTARVLELHTIDA